MLAKRKIERGGSSNTPLTKRGFTLIEVLGIIIVLGIVSVITIPFVYNVIEGSKKNAFKETVEGIVKAADVYYARNSDKMYKHFEANGGLISFIFDENLGKEGISAEGYKIEYSGAPPIAGKVLLYNDGTIEVENLTNGRYYANKDADTQIVITDTSTILTREELTKAIKDLQDLTKEMNKKITVLTEENKGLKSEITTLNAQVKTNVTNIANLKKQVDTNTTNISNMGKNQLNKTYPVGSIYISTSSTSPSTLFGGTWEAYGTGRTLVGINTADGNFNTVNKTGGSASTTLAAGNLPSHTHSIPALSGSTSSAGAHTHTTAAVSITNGATNTVGNHNHTYSATTSSGGAHTHRIWHIGTTSDEGQSGFGVSQTTNFENRALIRTAYTINHYWDTASAGSHSHTVSGTTSTTGNHSHTVTGTVPAQTTSSSGGHTHTVSTNASTTGASGSGTAFTNLQPYITVYMWRRTA